MYNIIIFIGSSGRMCLDVLRATTTNGVVIVIAVAVVVVVVVVGTAAAAAVAAAAAARPTFSEWPNNSDRRAHPPGPQSICRGPSPAPGVPAHNITRLFTISTYSRRTSAGVPKTLPINSKLPLCAVCVWVCAVWVCVCACGGHWTPSMCQDSLLHTLHHLHRRYFS